jgi:hypothetical protein
LTEIVHKALADGQECGHQQDDKHTWKDEKYKWKHKFDGGLRSHLFSLLAALCP